MAKKIATKNGVICSASDLVTPHDKTRAGFIAMALEKNNIATPFVEEARTLKVLATRAKNPNELLAIDGIQAGLLAASGLSEKAQNHLEANEKAFAIQEFIKQYLLPAGKDFVDELVYRFLLTKGDALGGKARNLAGALGERKFLRSLLSVFCVAGIELHWLENEKKSVIWNPLLSHESGIENRIKAIAWKQKYPRILILNSNIPIVGNNIDVTVCEGEPNQPIKTILSQSERIIALGELKGGIDPAGADEHWKTANSALERIHTGFKTSTAQPATFFIGAAIEKAMAEEIFRQLSDGTLQNAANLTNDEQLTTICRWIADL